MNKDLNKTKEELLIELENLRKENIKREEKLNSKIQQLAATEQQLRASNQQLMANNKQLATTEKALRYSEEKFRLAFKGSPDAINITRLSDGELVEASDSFEKITGHKIKDSLGRKTTELELWANLEDRDRMKRALLKKGRIDNFEFIRKMKSGRKAYTVMSAAIIKINNEPHLISEIRDIDELKKVENSLRESETKFRHIFNSTQDAIGVSVNGKHFISNPSYVKMFAYETEKEVIGKPILDLIAPEARKQIIKYINLRKNDKAPQAYETKGLRKDGTIFDMEAHVSTYMLDDKKYTVVVLRDITERKQLVEKLLSSEQQLQASNQQLKATVQQLTATEQQLRASNQQLEADKQQLIATEQQLRATNQNFLESEARLTEAELIAQMGNFIWDIETGNVTWSDGLHLLLGYDKSEKIDYNKVNVAIHHPDDLERITNWLNECIASRKSKYLSNEYRIIHKNGKIIHVKTTIKLLFKDNIPTQMIGTVQDITELKQKEKLIKESDERNRLILNTTLDGYILADHEGQIINVNPSYCQMIGYSADELCNMTIQSIESQLDEDEVKERIHKMVSEGKARFETKHKAKDGRIIDFEVSISIIQGKDGEPMVAAFLRDITDSKQAKIELKEAKSNLEAVLNNRKDSIWSLDRNYNYQVFNKAYAEVILKEQGVSIEKGMNSIAIHPKEVHEFWKSKFDTVLKGEYVDFEFSYVLDGEERFFEVYMNPIVSDGEVTGLSALSMDVSERKQIELQIRINLKRLEEAERIGKIGNWSNFPASGQIVWSEGMYRIYGCNSKTDTIDYEKLLSLIHPEDREKHNVYFERMKDIKPGEQFDNLEYRIIRPNGQLRWLDVKFETEFDQNNIPQKFFGTVLDITDRKIAEEYKNELLDTLTNAEEIAGMGSYKWMLDANELSWSDNMIRLYGLEPDKYKPSIDSLWQYIHPEDISEFDSVIKKLLKEKKIQPKLRYRIIRPDKKIVWLEGTNEIIFDSKGQIKGIIGIVLDITEKKKREDELIFQEKLLTAVEQSIIVSKPDGEIIYWNPFAEKTYGWKANEVIGKNIMSITVPQIAEEQGMEIMKNLNAGNSWSGEFDVQDKNGRIFPSFVSDTPVFNDKDELIAIIGVSFDISERRQAEMKIQAANLQLEANYQQLQATEQQLRATNQQLEASNKEIRKKEHIAIEAQNRAEESEKKFRILVENSPIGIFLNDADGNAIYINDKCAQIIGIPSENALNLDWVPYIHNEDRERVLSRWTETVGKGKSFSEDYRWVHTDGKIVWTHGETAPVKDKNGKVIVYIGTLTDITKRKQTELELIKAKEKAEESDRLKSAFLSNMSHEIRTPMNGILGFSSLLKKPQLTGEKRGKYISIIENSGKRMLDTINDIIDISKIEAGQVKVVKSVLSVNAILEEQYNFFYPEAKLKELEFIYETKLSENEGFVFTDKQKLEGILINLIKNAIKYTNQGKIKLNCKINNGNVLEFSVKDTGIGIPADRLEAIFNRFEQADIEDKGVFEGSGLGLAISKSYVEMLGGKIWVTSKEESGSTFYFTIPYVHKSQSNILLSEKEENPKSILYQNLSLLVAEDDKTSINLFETVFEGVFDSILYASNGKDTLKLFKENPGIDIILMDIKMADINGYEVTREIRKTNKKVRIIAQTAFALEGDREKALAAGCDEYLTKPIDREVLFEKINACMDNKLTDNM